MAFKMKGSPAKMGTIKGTTAHRSALRQVEEEKNLLKRHEEWKTKRADKRKAKIESGEIMGTKEKMQRKYGTGEYARSGEKAHLAMNPGESKFQYDVRMRKEARKAAKTEEKRELGVLEEEVIDTSDLTEKERLALGENIIPEAPASTAEVIPNTYGTFDGDDWSKVDEVSGLNLHQLVNKRDELALAGNKESHEYSKVQEAINIANASKTKTWGSKKDSTLVTTSELKEYLEMTAEDLKKQNPNITAKEMADSLRYYRDSLVDIDW